MRLRPRRLTTLELRAKGREGSSRTRRCSKAMSSAPSASCAQSSRRSRYVLSSLSRTATILPARKRSLPIVTLGGIQAPGTLVPVCTLWGILTLVSRRVGSRSVYAAAVSLAAMTCCTAAYNDVDFSFMLIEISDSELFFQTITLTGEKLDEGVVRKIPREQRNCDPITK